MKLVLRPALLILLCPLQIAAALVVSGRLLDTDDQPVAGAEISLVSAANSVAAIGRTDESGNFALGPVPEARYTIVATRQGFSDVRRQLEARPGDLALELKFARLARRIESINVTASEGHTGILFPDPAERILVREELLDANPGHPGVPISIPGLPAETASSGIKAPQYFAPGVGGDHGEPIAQYLQVGSFLFPNNLSANAHGNGYSDPNIMIPATVESVQVDGGAFNVLEGNHSVNLAAIYGLRPRLDPFFTIGGDQRDADITAGLSSWLAIQTSFGNGLLHTPEHRQQYKVNAIRTLDLRAHRITLVGMGYYGESRIPGLVPLGVPDLDDTIDPRQHDQTHSTALVANDTWQLSEAGEVQLSGFFRTYNLALYSNFGDGLIRQSEFRTVAGSEASYVRRVNRRLSILAGVNYLRDAPSRLDLDRYDGSTFQKVTANNVVLGFISPYVALEGALLPWFRFYLGWRRDQIAFDNVDLLTPANSLHRWVGVDSPKATVTLGPLSFSYGQSFFTNDPRIGNGSGPGTPVSRAHSYQVAASKTLLGTDFRVTLGHITQEQSLGKIDPDTGLQEDVGPSRNRYVSAAARRYFPGGFFEVTASKADARDLTAGAPIPEAPRFIFDVSGAFDRLPRHLHARAEYELVGRKPLGDGFVGVPVKEFRGSVSRSLRGGRMDVGLNFLVARGYTGQTVELDQVAGVRLPSYASVSYSYHFLRR